MSNLKHKYYDGFQINKILNEELDDGKAIMRILLRFADEPSAQPEIIRCGECKHHEGETYCHERDGLWYENDYCRYAERKEQDDG